MLFDGEPVRRETPPDGEFPLVLLAVALLVLAVVTEVTVVTDVLTPGCGLLEFRIGLCRLFALLLNGL